MFFSFLWFLCIFFFFLSHSFVWQIGTEERHKICFERRRRMHLILSNPMSNYNVYTNAMLKSFETKRNEIERTKKSYFYFYILSDRCDFSVIRYAKHLWCFFCCIFFFSSNLTFFIWNFSSVALSDEIFISFACFHLGNRL